MANISKVQERDTCLALTFLLLLIWLFVGKTVFVYMAMALLLFGMVWPGGMRPLAVGWFGLSHLLGKVMSTVLLSMVFFLVLLPVACVRRIMGKDALRLYQWRKDPGSCFVVREHVYTKEDLEHPY